MCLQQQKRRITFLLKRLVLALILFILIKNNALAQSLPSTASPSGIERSLRTPPKSTAKKPPVTAAPAEQEPMEASSQEQQDTFILRSVSIHGATALTSNKLTPIYQTSLNKYISVADLNGLLAAIRNTYTQAGYPFVHVDTAPFDPQIGALTILITETRLGEVTFSGVPEIAEHPLVEKIKNKLLAQSVLRQADIEQATLTINELPGVTAKASLYAVKKGVFGLRLTLERQEWKSFSSLDNRGSRYVGPWQTSIGSTKNGVFSPLDSISMRGLTGTDNQELRGAQVFYNRTLHESGTELRIASLKIWSEPGYTLKKNRIESTSERLNLGINQPIFRHFDTNLFIAGTFSFSKSDSKAKGALYSEDKLRTIDFSTTYDIADRLGGVNLMQVSVRQGLPIFDSSQNGDLLLSRANGKVDFTKTTLYAARTQDLGWPFSVFAAVSGQYAFTQLLSPEQFGFGGNDFGRGYDPSEIVGDHGLAASIELRYAFDTRVLSTLTGAQAYTSYDVGSVWNIDSNRSVARSTAASTAVGIRLSLWDNIASLDMQVSKPATRSVAAYNDRDGNDPRCFISLRITL